MKVGENILAVGVDRGYASERERWTILYPFILFPCFKAILVFCSKIRIIRPRHELDSIVSNKSVLNQLFRTDLFDMFEKL